MKSILFCPKCKKYTLKEKCSRCQVKTISSKPPKFSPINKYGNYRREEKKKELKEKGLY